MLSGQFCDIAFGRHFWIFVFNWQSRKICTTRAFENACVETNPDRWNLTLLCLEVREVKDKNLLVKISDLFSAYGLLLPPGINRLAQLCVKSTKSITVKTTFEKNYYEQKIIHGLHNMFYFERKKSKKTFMQYFNCICLWVFVYGDVHFFS